VPILCVPNSEVLLVEMEASARLVVHLVRQSLQLFGKRRCAAVEHTCRHDIASEAFLWNLSSIRSILVDFEKIF